jgi:hypothetical protein
MAEHLGIHVCTLRRWAEHGIIIQHACNAHHFLYEDPGPNRPNKAPSRWNRLEDRGARMQAESKQAQLAHIDQQEA